MLRKILNTLAVFVALAVICTAVALTVIEQFNLSSRSGPTSDFTAKIEARLDGSNDDWQEEITAPAGSIVEFRITYTNTSNKRQGNVAVWAELPENVAYTPDSTILVNSEYGESGVTVAENTIASEGLTIGDYLGANPEADTDNAQAIVYFSAQIPETAADSALTVTGKVGWNQFLNTSNVNITVTDPEPVTDEVETDTPEDDSVSDDAAATV